MKALERVYKFEGTFNIRVWARATDLRSQVEHRQQIAALMKIVDVLSEGMNAVDIAEAFAGLPFCNAIEVQTGMEPAVIIYPEWP